MSIRQRSFVAAAVVLSFVLAFPACKPEHEAGGVGGTGGSGGGGVKANPVSIRLTKAANGDCQQNGVAGTTLTMQEEGVIWAGPDANTQIEVHFPSGCGLANGCDYGPSTPPIRSGKSTTTPRTITYNSIKIGTGSGNGCTLHGDGLIMH